MSVSYQIRARDSVVLKKNNLTYCDYTSPVASLDNLKTDETAMFVHFHDIPDIYKYKVINSIGFSVFCYNGTFDLFANLAVHPSVFFDVSTASPVDLWKTGYPGGSSSIASTSHFHSYDNPKYLTTNISYSSYGSNAFFRALNSYKNGFAFIPDSTSTVNVSTATGDYPPLAVFEFSDADYHLLADSLSPSGGFVDNTKDFAFSFKTKTNGYIIETKAFENESSFALEWRVDSGSEVKTVAGSASGVSIPAYTFPNTGTFQARLKIIDALGYESYSAWQTYSTDDAIPTATALSPINSIIGRESAVKFSWSHSISTGTPQSKAEIQYSRDGITWADYATVTGSAQETTLSTEQFYSGIFYWRVRTYNSDNVPGSWSSAVSFYLIAPPQTPIVSTNEKPIATVSWQTDDQQAFQFQVVGVFDSDIRFGSDKTFRLPVILPDGDYTVRVRVQNDLGMWSEWGEAPLRVRNVPGEPINLNVQLRGYDAELIWNSADSYERYIVYRNDKAVAVVDSNSYIDPMAHGETTWRVAGLLAGSGYYTMSDTSAASLGVSGVGLRDFEGGEWLHLEKTQNQYAEQVFTFQRSVTYRHFAGASLPVAELGEDCERTVAFTAAITDRAELAALEAMQGKQVICKTGEELVVGILDKVTRTRGIFFDSFEITLRGIHFEEAVEI